MDYTRDIRVGQPAPDFTLEDENESTVNLGELRGAPVVLVFYPFDWSPLCMDEICSLRDGWGGWEKSGARVFGISRDSIYSHRAWKEHLGLNFSLLADLDGKVARRYGAWNEELHRADRLTVGIDPAGIVRYVVHNHGGKVRDHKDALRAVESMAAGAYRD